MITAKSGMTICTFYSLVGENTTGQNGKQEHIINYEEFDSAVYERSNSL